MERFSDKTAAYIGRFQPPHNGHMSAIRQINESPDINRFIIGIGSTQYKGYLDHPFPAELREEMIRKSITDSKPYDIVHIPDIHDYPRWVSYVESLCPEFDVVYSENPVVKNLFGQTGYEVRPIVYESTLSATQIRNLMIQGRQWQHLVPPAVKDILEQYEGARRLHDIYLKHLKASVTADIIIDYKGQLVVIRRGNEPYKDFLALPGGYMEVGQETIEETARREAWEETGLEIAPEDLNLLGVYSAPKRDPRGPTVSTTFYAKVNEGKLKAGDDAKEIHLINPRLTIPRLAFDHNKMIVDYLKRIQGINRTGVSTFAFTNHPFTHSRFPYQI